MNKITTIVFDLGGVLLDLDPTKTMDGFAELGLEQTVCKEGYSYQHDFFYEIEKGDFSPAQFRNHVRDLLPEYKSDEEINKAWCAMLLNFPKERVDLLRELAKTHTLYLLSNTNQIHADRFRALFLEQHGVSLDSMFTECYLSHELNLRKPDPKIYELVTDKIGVPPSEIIFLDDSKENLEASEKFDWQTCYIPRHGLMSVYHNEIKDRLL